jgi:hypothetical protein
MRFSIAAALSFLLPAAIACEKGGSTTQPPDAAPVVSGSFFPCDVEAVLKAKCHTCHTMPMQMCAPFPLLEHANTQMVWGDGKVWEAMKPAIESDFMPLSTSPTGPLTPAQKTTMLTWLNAGAPAAGQPCPTGGR